MKNVMKMGIFTSLLTGMGLAAQPIVKTGDCPALTRYNAPSEEEWSQFPIKPNTVSEFPVGTIQNALTPAQSINCTETQPGLKVEVWASESDLINIAYLQHFTFDERGRMWAVEPKSYPNIIRAAGSSPSVTDNKFVGGQDRIVILEDTDGDRVMDKLKVFKDGLNLPQSIEIVNGGVVITMGPYIVYFPNNSDVAGTPQILFSGMGPTGNYDTHGGINSIMYGLDNWIYGLTGYNSCKPTGTSVDCAKGWTWRFRHTALGHSKTVFENWSKGPSNAAGLGQMEDGQIFQSGATGTAHINHSIREGADAIDIRTASASAERNLFYPITGDRFLWEGSTAKNGQGWFTSLSTAVSGLQFYTSRLFPKKYWNRFAFTCEGSSKLCNQDSLVASGSTWKAMRMAGPTRSNILASKDAWVAPLLAKTGPDGAVWVLDWYNYLFLHNPATPSGAGSAWNNHLRTKTRNRIYRITPTDAPPETILNLSTATTEQLVSTLANPNFMWRLHAQRLLIAKGYTAELGTLLENILSTDKSVDAVDNNPNVMHALWTLEGLGRLDIATELTRLKPILSRLLLHPATGVRRNVLRALPRTTAAAEIINENCSVNDPQAHVRLQALVAFAETSSKPSGLKGMYTTYQNVDTYASSAFTASGVPSSTTLACSPSLEPVSTAPMARMSQPRDDLRFSLRRGGFTLQPHGRLASGTLSVFNLKGRITFRSTYDASALRWSIPTADGLLEPVYGYEFRGTDGSLIQGRISPISSL